MSFLRRAKSMHERGDSVRAAVILAEGLKRDSSDGEALEWLLHLYVEELPNPGIEGDLMKILAAQPNGQELYRIVESELSELGQHAKLKALERLGGRDAVASVPVSAPERAPAADDRPASGASVAAHSSDHPATVVSSPVDDQRRAEDDASMTDSNYAHESWDSFDNPIDARRRTGRSTAIDETQAADAGDADVSRLSGPLSVPQELTFDDEAWDDDTMPSSAANSQLWWWVGGGIAALALLVVLAMTLSADDSTSDVEGEFEPDTPAADAVDGSADGPVTETP